jgi:primary-amine oxidase
MVSVGLGLAGALMSSEAAAGSCPGGPPTPVTTVNQVFSSGSRWRFSVQRWPCQGLVFNDVKFTPKGGVERTVLHRANIAQIHVPYHPGSPRFHDLSTSIDGMGVLAQPLAPAECPGGARYDGNRVCKQLHDRGHAWKNGSTFALGSELSIFMSSQLGRYNYINHWTFRDDGTIEPRVGLTGRLQILSASPGDLANGFGSRLNRESDSSPSVGLSHLHNMYYRLDFDIGNQYDDAVDRIEYSQFFGGSCSAIGQCGSDSLTRFSSESNDYISPDNYTSWRVFDTLLKNADGRNIGYEIVPEIHGLWSGMTADGEPWSNGELWVTQYDGCELLAFDNRPPFIPSSCSGAPEDVTEMADAEDVDGADLVVWYVNRHRHFVRDEDEPDMPIEWTGFHISPRSFFHQNPMQ